MKLFINPLKTLKSFFLYKKYYICTFILNKKGFNKIQLKKYFYINYSIKINKINIIKVKKKFKKKKIIKSKIKILTKIIVKFNKTIYSKKFIIENKKNE